MRRTEGSYSVGHQEGTESSHRPCSSLHAHRWEGVWKVLLREGMGHTELFPWPKASLGLVFLEVGLTLPSSDSSCLLQLDSPPVSTVLSNSGWSQADLLLPQHHTCRGRAPRSTQSQHEEAS